MHLLGARAPDPHRMEVDLQVEGARPALLGEFPDRLHRVSPWGRGAATLPNTVRKSMTQATLKRML
ncbi:hypothetical protein GCM10022205_02190 [Spinactinospora alkalitolerans]